MTKSRDVDNLIIEGFDGLSTTEKSDLWSTWSQRGNSFPYELEEVISQINMDMNLDIHASYGFKVAYYMFMEDWDRETTEDYFQVDDYYRIYGT